MRAAKTWCGRGPERIHSEMHANLILEHPEDESPVSVVLRDISLDGAGLLHSSELGPSTRLLLQLPAIRGMPLSIRAHVVASRMLEPGRYRIGVQFDPHDTVVLERLRDALLL